MNIRKLEPKDFDNGFFETLEHLSTIGNLDVNKAKSIHEKMLKTNCYNTYVMEDEDKIVGTVTLFVEQKFIHECGLVGHIEDVVTRKKFEGKGIGKALMNYAISEAKKQGCYKIILDCADNNIPFYEKLGFYKKETCMRLDLK